MDNWSNAREKEIPSYNMVIWKIGTWKFVTIYGHLICESYPSIRTSSNLKLRCTTFFHKIWEDKSSSVVCIESYPTSMLESGHKSYPDPASLLHSGVFVQFTEVVFETDHLAKRPELNPVFVQGEVGWGNETHDPHPSLFSE